MFNEVDWTRPWLRPFAAIGTALGSDPRAALNRHAAGIVNARGLPLRFVPQAELPAGIAYEAHIFDTGAVPTRDNLHDAFNALIWLHFPETKRLLNRLQAEEIARAGVQAGRGGLRDALTLFDENAAIFLCEAPALESALRDFQWEALFVTSRAAWGKRCAVVPFGHALLEKLAAPYKSITAHAWPLAVSPRCSLDEIDRMLAASLLAASGTLLGGRSFAPLPVMGIPGWCDDNAAPAFYADPSVFRPGRRR